MGMSDFEMVITFIFEKGLIPIASMFTSILVFQMVLAVILLGIIFGLLHKIKD